MHVIYLGDILQNVQYNVISSVINKPVTFNITKTLFFTQSWTKNDIHMKLFILQETIYTVQYLVSNTLISNSTKIFFLCELNIPYYLQLSVLWL